MCKTASRTQASLPAVYDKYERMVLIVNSSLMLSGDDGSAPTVRAGKMLRELYGTSSPFQISPLRQDECAWFGVGDGNTDRRILRVSEFGRHTPAEMESEIIWITELIHDTDLLIPRPVAGKSGRYVQTFGSPEDPDGGVCVLLSLPETALLGGAGSKQRIYVQLGETAALLHQSALLWDAGEKLSRPTLPYESVLSRRPAAGKSEPFAPEILPGLLAHAADTVRRRLEAFGRSEDRFGLIHGALCPENLLTLGDRMGALDFSACEFGWFLYDFAPAVDGEPWDKLPELASAWLEGYRTQRKVSRKEAQMLPTFAMLRRLEQLAACPARIGSAASFASGYLREFG